MERDRCLQTIADMIAGLKHTGILRVGVDGTDGAGKTTFANELANVFTSRQRNVIRASVDGFHNPKSIRYRLGQNSPEGFFLESYNYAVLKSVLLDPLSPGGTGHYRTSIFDVQADTALAMKELFADPGAILIFDGIFLHRPELRNYWDFSIFLDVSFDVSIPRGAVRGFGSPDPRSAENQRYVLGQQIYFRDCDPKSHASVVIDNNDLANPRILVRR